MFHWKARSGAKDAEAVPSYVLYNAFRWLRDSGFDPGKLAASNGTQAAEPEILAGLLKYSELHGSYPGRDGLGVLAFGRDQFPGADARDLPRIASPRLAAVVWAFMTTCVVAGFALMLRALEKKPSRTPVSRTAASLQ